MLSRLLPTVLLLWGLFSSQASDIDWRKKAGTFSPGGFETSDELTARYAFGWSGIKAASVDVALSKEKEDFKMVAAGGTSGAVRLLWKLDARFESFCGPRLKPIQLEQTEDYLLNKKTIIIDFEDDAARTWQWKTPDPKPKKPKKNTAPNIQSMHSTLLVARTLPLEEGDVLSFVILPGTTLYYVEFEVTGREQISIQSAQRDAIRMDVEIFKVDDGELEPHGKLKSCTAWISDDELRIPLLVKADIFVGHVFAELEEIIPR